MSFVMGEKLLLGLPAFKQEKILDGCEHISKSDLMQYRNDMLHDRGTC